MTITRLAAAAAGVAVLTACSTSGSSAPPTVDPVPAVSGAPTPAESSADKRSEPDLGAPETVATGLDVPWGLAFRDDGSALVAERDTGRILEIAAGGGKPREVYRVPGVASGGEGGLLGLAIKDDWVYAYFTAADDNRIVRFKLSGGDPEVIFDGIVRGSRHNGGRLAFGPDGMLYVGTGDASEESRSQDRADPSGKILRLTPEGRPAPGNPWAGSPVWSMGHRNVQGLAWDSQGRMYGIEFGQNTWDEVNVIEKGKNYGWPEVEGKGDGDDRFTDPIVQWTTDEASPSGAAVTGGTLYVAALKGERLWTVPLGGGTAKAEFTGVYGRLRTVAVAPDGSLWLTTSNTDGRGDAQRDDDRILRFPAR
ncbi:PQQ-dependent sugar dehydrogenase [Actinoplanes derwentensis]|uniref:Glucose/arabinose dehydrogenase, beta-propeller fold n=1 Tax=Actinoplanes derwentensis TaxID=113562 RepID=A0A1H2D9E8_9ACTN|nr:PQQ-dependent sugar dehydrogenase [Actinoplanes derwentensis]GID81518.1 oxidoreductase [Actinoplanes derwentensis]SDT79214.1 Glucose/arabinose dehydrogenase, beta-propeller fold [Actinoplanes derwentensis]